MKYRSCLCAHGFPLCACHEALDGHALLRRSRWLSAVAGYPSPALDAEVVASHQAAVQAAATARRAAKPRVPLGTKVEPPADCVPCREKAQ